jgi:hypothetical protein
MTYLRSAIFQFVFYLSFIVQMIIFTPIYFLLPRKAAYRIPKNWAASNIWLAKHIAGLSSRSRASTNCRRPASSWPPSISRSSTHSR